MCSDEHYYLITYDPIPCACNRKPQAASSRALKSVHTAALLGDLQDEGGQGQSVREEKGSVIYNPTGVCNLICKPHSRFTKQESIYLPRYMI